MRGQFDLPEDDVAALTARGAAWETVIEANVRWLLVRGFRVPEGYNHREAVVALRLPPGYPSEQIDMAYFLPALALLNGGAIKNLSELQFDGAKYQQWSRHRTPANPWQAGVDSVGTHLLLVEEWLARELAR